MGNRISAMFCGIPNSQAYPTTSLFILAICLTLSSHTIAAEPPTLTSSQLTILQGPERDRFLAAHNTARKNLDLKPLAWSDDLAAHAVESLQQQQASLIRA